jgi:hypothetical protein
LSAARYGVAQAVLAAIAIAHHVTIAEVVRDEYETGLYHLKYLPVTGGGHLRWPWEGPRSRRFPGELRARERDRRPGLVSPKQARFRELVVGAEPPRGPVMT